MANEQRIAQIKTAIATREGKPGYTRNVEALKAELAKLTAEASRTANPTK